MKTTTPQSTRRPFAVPAIAGIIGLACAASVSAQDTLTADGFEGDGTGSFGNWTAAGNAFLKEDAALATTGDFSAELYSGGTITTTDSLPLGSKGYTSVTLTVSAKWVNGSTTRRFQVRYAADGVNFVTLADADIGDTDATDPGKTPTTVTLTVGSGINATNVNSTNSGAYSGEPFTDQAKFQIFYSSNLSSHRVYLDDISITASPEFSGLYWDSDGATAGSGGPSPTGTWGVDSFWSTSPDGDVATAAWTPGQVAVFSAGSDANGAYTVTVNGTQSISGLSFKDGSPTLTGGTFNMTSDSFAFVADGLTASVASAITDDAGNRVLSRTGSGTLVLSGSNGSASGSMALNSGITRFDAPAAIIGSGKNLTINSGGILTFGGSFDGTSIQTALNDRVVTTSAGTIAVDGNTAVDFDFATAGLTAAYLGAIADTTYNGLLTPEGVTYRLGGGTGKLTLSNTSGMNQASPTLQVLGNVEISGNITGVTGTFTKQNTGTLTLSGANTYAANTTASGGTLVLAGSNNQATQTTINAATVQLASNSNGGLASGPVSMAQNTAVLQAVGEDRAINNDVLLNASPTISGPQSLTISGALTTNNANRQLNNNIVSGESLTLAGQVNLSNNDTGRTLTIRSGATSGDAGIGQTFITGNIVDGGAGAGGLTLDSGWRDSEPFYLSGTNTYSGMTELKNGLVRIQGIQALSPNTTVRLNHTSGNNGKIALLDDSAGNIVLPNTIQTYTNNSTGNHTIFVGNNNTANGGTSSGTTTGSTFVISTLDFNFIKSDTQYSSVNITGVNDYSLRIDAVTLNNANARTAGQNWQARFNPTTASVSLGDVTMPDGNALKGIPFLQLEGSASGNVVTGNISEASDALTTGRPLSLNKTGASEWTLQGTNTYTGGTTVNAGTLTIDGSLADSSMSVTGGTVNGSGTLTFNPTDQIDISGGTVDLSGFTVEGSGLTDPVYVIVDSVDGGSYTGTFATVNVPGYTVDYDYDGLGTQVALVSGAPVDPFVTWAGTGTLGPVTFGGDTNGDGVQDGLAFLLGAANPDDNALGLLPTVTETGGGLVMTFSMRDSASRGTATLSVEHSSDLGITDPWSTPVAVPDATPDPQVPPIDFQVSGGPGTLSVIATISSSEAAAGKLFGRLKATE